MKSTAKRVAHWLILASVAILGALALLGIIGYATIQRQVDTLAYNAEMLDLTSKQRALSEEALSLANEPTIDTGRLSDVLDSIEEAQAQLRGVPHASDNTASLLRSLEPSLNQVSASGRTLIAGPEGEDVGEVRSLMAAAQAEFNSGMERTTSSLEQDSAGRVRFIRNRLVLVLSTSVVLVVAAGGLVAVPIRRRLLMTFRGVAQAHGELKEKHVRLRRAYDESTNTNDYLAFASSRFEELFHGVPFACFSVDASGKIFDWNEAASDLFDVPSHRAVQQAVYGRIFGPSNDALLKSLIARAFYGEHIRDVELDLPRDNRRARQLLISVFPVRARRREPTAALIACANITQQKDAEHEARRANQKVGAILESIQDAFVALDSKLVYRYANQTAAEWLDMRPEDLVGRRVLDVVPELSESRLAECVQSVVDTGESATFDHHFESHDTWMEFRVYPNEEGVSVFYNDVTVRKKSEQTIRQQQDELEAAMEKLSENSEQLEHQRVELEEANMQLQELATTDGLTGLLNHRTMLDELSMAAKRAERSREPLSVALLDVDNFKLYNDEHGHQAGDEVLKSLASILRASVRSVDVVARYGGEEFCVILPGAAADEAAMVCERIRKSIEGAEWEHRDVTVSVGVTTSLDMSDPQRLIGRADQALYDAKAAGRNRVRTWEPPAAARCA